MRRGTSSNRTIIYELSRGRDVISVQLHWDSLNPFLSGPSPIKIWNGVVVDLFCDRRRHACSTDAMHRTSVRLNADSLHALIIPATPDLPSLCNHSSADNFIRESVKGNRCSVVSSQSLPSDQTRSPSTNNIAHSCCCIAHQASLTSVTAITSVLLRAFATSRQ